MPRNAQNPFEKAQTAHNKLVKTTPIGQAVLMNSLGKLESTGNTLVKAHDLGVIKFAIAMTAANTVALALNEAGSVQPPLTAEQTAAIEAKNETFQIFIDNDPGAGTAPAPTDPSAIPTGARKGGPAAPAPVVSTPSL